jgi:hypothetical protein
MRVRRVGNRNPFRTAAHILSGALLLTGVSACGSEDPPPVEVEDTAPDGPTPGVTVSATFEGDNWWKVSEYVIFSAPTADGPTAPIDCILGELNHVYNATQSQYIHGEAHDGPYEDELSRGIATCGYTNAKLQPPEAIEAPNTLFFGFMLVPNNLAPVGRTLDGEDMQLLPNATFPLDWDMDFYRNGFLAKFDRDRMYPTPQDLGLLGDGLSHLPMFFPVTLTDLPPDTSSTGDFHWEVYLRDNRGVKLDIKSHALLDAAYSNTGTSTDG